MMQVYIVKFKLISGSLKNADFYDGNYGGRNHDKRYIYIFIKGTSKKKISETSTGHRKGTFFLFFLFLIITN